jgi:hypothetical protein
MDLIPRRAAVLSAVEHVRTDEHGDGLEFTHRGKRRMQVRLVVLHPGQTAPALGFGVLDPQGPEWAQAGLGEVQKLAARLPTWMAIVLEQAGKESFSDDNVIPGPIDIPVWVDEATGVADEVDLDALEAEIAPWREAAIQMWKEAHGPARMPRLILSAPRRLRHVARDLTSTWSGAISELKADIKAPPPPGPMDGARPDDASHPPIEGVGYATWAWVRTGLERDRVHPSHRDQYIAYRGIPPARWEAVDAAWLQRSVDDPQVGTWARYDLQRLKPWGARW